MTKQILAFLFCFIRELTLYSLSSARELKPYTPPLPSPSAHLSTHTSHTTHPIFRPPIPPATHPTLKIPPLHAKASKRELSKAFKYYYANNNIIKKNYLVTIPVSTSIGSWSL